MGQYIVIFFILLNASILSGQIKHDYVWIMGTNGMPNNPNEPNNHWGVNILDFNGGELNITRDYRDTDFFLTNASICDTAGNLLFYSNGCNVFQADGELMGNGDGLNPGVAYDTGNCPQNGNPLHQGALILPLPNSDSLFYLFHKSTVWGEATPFLVYPGKLYYSIIDMSANNNWGLVTFKNELVLGDTLNEDLNAVRHKNNHDWWVLTSNLTNNLYYSILFTEDGAVGVNEQMIGPDASPWAGGKSVFSPDGTRLARYDRLNQVLLFDFDRETGHLGNLRHLEADTTFDGYDGSVAFSPSGRFLYVNSTLRVYQFDLQAPDIQASRVLLGEYDGYKYKDIFPADFGLMQLAPDCKIYFPTRSSTPFYHVIHHPDRKGPACGFEQRGLPLIATNIASIPNLPNYRLGTGFPVCDSTIQLVVGSVNVLPPQRQVLVYPNPASSHVTVEMPQPMASDGGWSLYNGMGQRVLSHKIGKGSVGAEIMLAGLPNGIFFWEMWSGGKRSGNGKLMVLK